MWHDPAAGQQCPNGRTQVLALKTKSERVWKGSEQSLGGVCYGPTLADPTARRLKLCSSLDWTLRPGVKTSLILNVYRRNLQEGLSNNNGMTY